MLPDRKIRDECDESSAPILCGHGRWTERPEPVAMGGIPFHVLTRVLLGSNVAFAPRRWPRVRRRFTNRGDLSGTAAIAPRPAPLSRHPALPIPRPVAPPMHKAPPSSKLGAPWQTPCDGIRSPAAKHSTPAVRLKRWRHRPIEPATRRPRHQGDLVYAFADSNLCSDVTRWGLGHD